MTVRTFRAVSLAASAFLAAPLLTVLPGTGAGAAAAEAPSACGGTRDAYVGSTYSGTTKTTGKLRLPGSDLLAPTIDTEAALTVKFTKDPKGNYWAHTTTDGKVKDRSGYTVALTGTPSVEFNAKMHEPELNTAWQMADGDLKHIEKLDSVGKFRYGFKLAAKNCLSNSQTPKTLTARTDNGLGVSTTTTLTRQS
ncbi:hypothetical protein AB0N81_33715 [Streptomyces sp. NPDC093510]|uniref:hypothetical protein n=1 Tax=Streptomyces sp. NPDC093510 TaxID=3155199 RepID=UPI00341A692E